MKLSIHAAAADNCNTKVQVLLHRIEPEPDRYRVERGPGNPNIHSTFTFTPENIVGEIVFGWSDFMGKTVGKAFEDGNRLIGLFDDDYEQLVRIAEAMHKSVRPSVVTVSLLTDLVFDWIKQSHRKATDESMTDYVLHECEKRIMAYMQDVSVRKRIIADVKEVYKLRSSFVHHGTRVSLDQYELLKRFQRHALLSLMALIPLAASPISKSDFFDDLENRRLRG